MNINEMQAGRKLDALINWHVFKRCAGGDARHLPECVTNCEKCSLEHMGFDYEHPNYSTDITDAWIVWGKLPRKSNLGFAISISLIDEEMSSEPDKRVYIVIATYHGATMCGGMADTPGLAICRAALKIVQENTE